MVKAQILAGDRGQAGGVQTVTSPEDVAMVAEVMLGQPLITRQTQAEGEIVRQVYIEQGCEIARSFYLALLLDSRDACLTFLASPVRGSESIEEIATRRPEWVIQHKCPPDTAPNGEQLDDLCEQIGLQGEQAKQVQTCLQAMYQVFIEYDASLIEISPLAVLESGEVMALDIKMSLDDNGLYRQPEAQQWHSQIQRDPAEAIAKQHGFNYLRLPGNIGMLASGAGMALASLDAIIERGGAAANFMDIPPSSNAEQVSAAFGLLLDDSRLQAIMVNVFGGGIMRGDVLAEGILAAIDKKPLDVPLIVSLNGINAEQGQARLQQADIALTLAQDLADAAAKVVQAKPVRSKSLFGRLLGQS